METDRDDPYRMYLVVRRGAYAQFAPAAVDAGAAAVACLARFGAPPEWRARPGKVTLRARGGQWDDARDEAHAGAGDVLALPPRRRSQRGQLLERMQAMTSALEPPPSGSSPDHECVTYLLNPALEMSSGKAVAQVAHAAVMAAEALPEWEAAGCPARVLRPAPAEWAPLCRADGLAARVVDAGLTEVAPGTVTVLALAPADPP